MPSFKRFFPLLLIVALSLPAWAQRGALTASRSLSQLTDRSAAIVRGHVLSARVERHPEFQNLRTVVVTLRVKETLKGPASDTFTFRQYIWDLRDRADAAGYQKGQELLLLMVAPSQAGLSSPAGLEQGRFRILRDKTGAELAVNGHGNLGLFRGMNQETLAKKGVTLSARSSGLIARHRSGPVAVSELTVLIRELVQGSQ